jgi:hypothetical protein
MVPGCGNASSRFIGIGVSDGIRTRDVQIHSLALYQLSYAHREDSLETF